MLQLGPGTKPDIGHRNVNAVRGVLSRLGLSVLAADVGGNHGRTVQLHVASGRLLVSTVGRGEHEL